MECVIRMSHYFGRSPRRTFLGRSFADRISTINIPRIVRLEFEIHDSICGAKYQIVLSRPGIDITKRIASSPLSRKYDGSDREVYLTPLLLEISV